MILSKKNIRLVYKSFEEHMVNYADQIHRDLDLDILEVLNILEYLMNKGYITLIRDNKEEAFIQYEIL